MVRLRVPVVAVVASALAACTGGSASTTSSPPSPSSPAAAHATPTPVVYAPTVERFAGSDAESGAFAFLLTLRFSGRRVSGRLTFVEHNKAAPGRIDRSVVTVTGFARSPDPVTGTRHVELRLERVTDGAQTLTGHVSPVEVGLTGHPDYQELTLFGRAGAARHRFKQLVAIQRLPQGLDTWQHRRRLHHGAVHHLDVDGDGRRDLVAVVWSHVAGAFWGQGRRTVFVRFASGAIAAVDVPAMNTRGIGWVGAVRLPGMAGHQLVLFDGSGASNDFFDVVADIGGVLRVIDAPGDDGDWNSGGSVGTGSFDHWCDKGLLHVVYVKDYGFHAGSFRAHVHDTGWLWRDGGWLLISRVRVNLSGDQEYPPTRPQGHGLWGCG